MKDENDKDSQMLIILISICKPLAMSSDSRIARGMLILALEGRAPAGLWEWDPAISGEPRLATGWREYSPNAKGNFSFERRIQGFRRRPMVDLRRK